MQSFLRTLEERIHAQLSGLSPTSTEWISFTLPIPDWNWPPRVDMRIPHVFWASPKDKLLRVGIGRIAEQRVAGEHAFRDLDAARRHLIANRTIVGEQRFRDQLFVAFPFALTPEADSRAHALMFLPEVLLEQRGDDWQLMLTCARSALQNPSALVDRWSRQVARLSGSGNEGEASTTSFAQRVNGIHEPDVWEQRVEAALDAIKVGAIDKVVLSRSIEVAVPDDVTLNDILDRLVMRENGSTLFSLSDGEETLVGASPEHLAVVRGRRVVVDAMAGTAPIVAEGGRPGEPDPLQSEKLQREHRLVVRDVERALAACCDAIDVPERPRLKVLTDCRHLWSPIHAHARQGVGLLDIAERLHPTPAVSGAPRHTAVQWLEAHGDEQRRGWYTGSLGWLDTVGGGELLVALRCGVFNAAGARLYAGAGIVSGSDPHEEFDETECKLRTMLHALQGGDRVTDPVIP